MKRWFYANGYEWWLDREPPGDGEAGDGAAVRSHGDAEAAAWRLLQAERTQLDIAALLAPVASCDPALLSVDQQRRALAEMLRTGRLQLWRRHEWRGTVSAPPAGSSASSSRGSGSRRPGSPPPRPAGTPPPPPRTSPPAPPARLSLGVELFWYEFVLLDELDTGIADVDVEMTTPKGTRWGKTDGAGSIRVDEAPPGQGSATVDMESLSLALQYRANGLRRKTRLPQPADDFVVVTPSRMARTYRFPHCRTQRVMVVTRTDIVVAGADPRWTDLALDDASQEPCRFTSDAFDEVNLCSRGNSEPSRIRGADPQCPEPDPDAPAAAARAADGGRYTVKPGDSLWSIAECYLGGGLQWEALRDANWDLLQSRPPNLIQPGDQLRIPVSVDPGLMPDPEAWPGEAPQPAPPFLDAGIDDLHEALFDVQGDQLFDLLAQTLAPLPPPVSPPADPPVEAAQAFAAQAPFVAMLVGTAVGDLFRPFEPPEFDPVEHAGPQPPIPVPRPDDAPDPPILAAAGGDDLEQRLG